MLPAVRAAKKTRHPHLRKDDVLVLLAAPFFETTGLEAMPGFLRTAFVGPLRRALKARRTSFRWQPVSALQRVRARAASAGTQGWQTSNLHLPSRTETYLVRIVQSQHIGTDTRISRTFKSPWMRDDRYLQ